MKRFGTPIRAAILFVWITAPAPAGAQTEEIGRQWESIHEELHHTLAKLSEEYFGVEALPPPVDARIVGDDSPTDPWLIVVGFTGGLESGDSRSSGIASMRRFLDEYYGGSSRVVALSYNNFKWKDAARDIAGIIRAAAERPLRPLRRQPLLVVYGHSWGAGAIAKMGRELQRENLEISLAIYVDAFTWRNPRVPANVRYAVNFYQRAGVLKGLPMRGKSKLIAVDPARTTLLGNYRIKPLTNHWGWSWTLVQPLLYRQHHLIAHDLRLRQYLRDIVTANLEHLRQLEREDASPEPDGLFDRVVIIGASVSASARAPSPGLVLARHAGTPPESIFVFAEGGAGSDRHQAYLDNIQRLNPSLIIGLDLFFHDFGFSLFLTEAKKQYIRDYIRQLHETGAIVVIGNIPDLVLLRHEHANRFFQELSLEFPNLVLLDIDELVERMNRGELRVSRGSLDTAIDRNDIMADRLHPTELGSAVLAQAVLDAIRQRFPARTGLLAPLDLGMYLEAESAAGR